MKRILLQQRLAAAEPVAVLAAAEAAAVEAALVAAVPDVTEAAAEAAEVAEANLLLPWPEITARAFFLLKMDKNVIIC